MSSEIVTARDLAAVEIYIPSADRFKNLFDRLWLEAVKPVWHNIYHPANDGRVNYSAENGALEDWGFIRPPFSPYDSNIWWVGWGITFPGIHQRWSDAEPRLPTRSYAFVCLWSDDERRQPLPPTSRYVYWMLGNEWSTSTRRGPCLIKAHLISDFNPDGECLASEMIEWMRAALAQLRLVAPNIARDALALGERLRCDRGGR